MAQKTDSPAKRARYTELTKNPPPNFWMRLQSLFPKLGVGKLAKHFASKR